MSTNVTYKAPTGPVGRGWQLTKSAWQVFKLDKELAAMPLFSFIASVAAIVPFGLVLWHTSNDNGDGLGYWAWPFWLAFYLVLTTIVNFFSGAVIHGAVTRFRGGDPTIRTSLAAVSHKFKPLLLFSLMMSTVALLLDQIREHVPFAGQVATWLFDGAWNIANFFAIPIIVMSDKDVKPWQATHQSVKMVKEVWGESVVVEAGISFIAMITAVAYSTLPGSVIAALYISGYIGIPGLIVSAAFFGVGLLAIMLVISTISGIAKAAIYHYASTGEAPADFNRELLRTAMTPKKARKIFG